MPCFPNKIRLFTELLAALKKKKKNEDNQQMLTFSSYCALSDFFLEWKVEIYSGFLLSLYYFSSKNPIKTMFFLKLNDFPSHCIKLATRMQV